jgi:diguanylate cyclase (GGDEF)-like protein
VGVGLTLGSRRGRVWTPRLAADTTLILLAVVAAALRLVVEPALAQAAGSGADRTLLAILQTVTVVPVFLAAQVVLRRGTALSPSAGSLLLAATLFFALGGLFSLTHLDRLLYTVRDPSDYVELTGWLLFALAGFRARSMASTAPAMLAGRRAPDALRRLLVPGAALFLAVAVVDMGIGRPPRLETVVAVALLAVVLAVRTAQAFNLADREAHQRRQLAHTRALVDVTHALAGATDLDKTLRIISESARSVFGTRGAGIELITEDGESLETRSAVGLPDEVLGLRFPLQSSFTGWVVQHEEPRATVDPSRDPYIQPQSLSFLGRWPVAAAPIHFRGETLGALFACIRPEPFDVEELELMGALAEQAAIAIQQARLFEQVTILSITDPLTGLANRRQLEIELPREFAAARRGRDLTAVIFDLDMFKHYNDTYGHLAGDQALQAFARSLQMETRAMNLAARYGGDEFVAVLAGTDAAGGRTFIDRVRKRFAREVEELGHGPLPVSAGLAEFAPDMLDPEALLRAADDELYRAKPRARV